MWAILMISVALLAVTLFRVQISQGAKLQQLAQEQQTTFLRPFVPRRQIVDRTGTVVALDRPMFSLFAHPKLFKASKTAIAEQLAPILNRPAADLVKKFDQDESGIRVEYSLTENVVDRIDRLGLDGIERVQLQHRLYPQQDLLAGILGYVNDEHKGQAGVELSRENVLERSIKTVKLKRMGNGALMPDQVPGGFLNVDDLQLKLTLDARLQRAAIAPLKQQLKAFNAKRGAVIVMDVRDGALLVLASEPSYDPNEYYKFPVERYKNWTLTDLYEPGSTFKPINVAIALETKAIKPDSTIFDSGRIDIDSWTIENYDRAGKGTLSITEVLQYSSNVGMVRIMQQLKPMVYYSWLKKIGLGEPVGIDLPSEVAGQFKDQKTFTESAIEPATASFGQGFSLTPIQLAQLYAAIANGGKLVTPHVVRGLVDRNGQSYWQPNLPPVRQVFSKATSDLLMPMLEQVVVDGTGKAAQIPGYRVGGKTGTAQKATLGGGYSESAKITSFVSVFPIDAPRYVVVAVVDEPKGKSAAGSTVAVPIVKAMMESLIGTEAILPSPPVRSKELPQ